MSPHTSGNGVRRIRRWLANGWRRLIGFPTR